MSQLELYETPIRAGVVGAGFFGRLHAQKYAGLPGVELVGVADPDRTRAVEIASKLGVEALGGHHALIGRVDCVSIASNAVSHAAVARDFLAAGVPVLIEKPIATTREDASELLALAAAKNVVVQVGHQERYVFAEAGFLDAGVAPLEIECWREGPFTGRSTDVSIVLDLMIHDIDLVHALAPGRVTTVEATVRNLPDSFSDEVEAAFEIEGGCRVRLRASRMAPERRRGMRVKYKDGDVAIDFIARTLTNTSGRDLKPGFVAGGPSVAAPRIADDPLGYSIASFVHSVRTGDRPLVSGADAARALDTALAILDAAGSSAVRAHT